jgi:hypothetical protein
VIAEDSTDFAAIRPDEWRQICPRCGGQKARVEFAVDNRRSRLGGRKPICKKCDSERSLARYLAKRGPKPKLFCSECEAELVGKQTVVCSSTCAERRKRRLHPEAEAEKQRAKRRRRRERAATPSESAR